LMARGQGRRILRWNMMMAPAMLLAFSCALPWGAEGMAWAFLLIIYASRYFHFRYVLSGTAISLRDLYQTMFWPACFSIGLAGIVFFMGILFSGDAAWIVLSVSLLVILLFSLICLLWLVPLRKECLEIWGLLSDLRRKEGM